MLLAHFDRKSPTSKHSLGAAAAILADARIDDRSALIAKLGVSHKITDEQIILEAYGKWGETCVDHMIGDFAFIIVDTKRNQIFCARDHMGARPFFYSLTDGELKTASDIASLVGGRATNFDRAEVASSLAYNAYIPSERTFFQHVKRLLPGHTLTVRPDSQELKCYWEPRSFPQLKLPSDDDYIAAGRDLLTKAVSDRLRTVERPAVHLSGGLDSSAVAAVAANLQKDSNRPAPPAYAWYLGDPDNPADDETRWAESARAALGLTMYAPPPTVERIMAHLRSDWTQGPNALNIFGEDSVMDLARSQGVDSILSGWGGDEGLSFNGRGYRAQLLTSLQWRTLASVCKGPFPIALARGIRQGLKEISDSAKAFDPNGKLALSYLRPEVAEAIELTRPNTVSLRSPQQAMTSLLKAGAQTARLEDWAVAGREYGISYSYPMLDRRVMEFALSLPHHLFYRPEARRWIMRKVLDPKLPDTVRWNDSKIELARVTFLRGLMLDAFRQCADLIKDRTDFGGTDEFVDVDRLLADLEGPKERVLDNFSNKRRALQFLKF